MEEKTYRSKWWKNREMELPTEHEEKRIEDKIRKWKETNAYCEKGRCSKCETRVLYNEEYDAHWCPKCNVWLEMRCGDPTCEYCPNRPGN